MGFNEEVFGFEIVEHLGVLRTYKTGWQYEVNLVDWNGNGPKLDIRWWNPSHEQMSTGLNFTDSQAKELLDILKKHFEG